MHLCVCDYTASYSHRYGPLGEWSNNVQKQDTINNVEFIVLDCSPLKFAILSHCNEWQSKFCNLLLDMASNRLSSLCAYMEDNAKRCSMQFVDFCNCCKICHRLKAPPGKLDQLGDSLTLLERLQNEQPKTEAQFQPLSDQFEILNKYEVLIPDHVSLRRWYLHVYMKSIYLTSYTLIEH